MGNAKECEHSRNRYKRKRKNSVDVAADDVTWLSDDRVNWRHGFAFRNGQ